jgi:uncharacterized repeat protein (TIGR02543 family)
MKKLLCVAIALLFALVLPSCSADEPEQNEYTVVYNANGGDGTMEDSTYVIGEAKNLNVNAFIRNGYAFDGWAASQSGPVLYTDRQSVAGLSAMAGDTVTLYAVWSVITVVPGHGLAGKLAWLQANAQSNVDYTVEVTADEDIRPAFLSYSGMTNIGITLKSTGAERIIYPLSNGSLFTVGDGVTLTLDNNITLHGRRVIGSSSVNNNAPLLKVHTYGTLVMNAGSLITGNYARDTYYNQSYGGGVSSDGTFIMNGGEISHNYAYASSAASPASYGGGVCITDGTFTMNDGEIFCNYAQATTDGSGGSYSQVHTYGGGVYVGRGTFIMNGGKISGNCSWSFSDPRTSYAYGGGVLVFGTFIMNGGEISRNYAYGVRNGCGGGVDASLGTFRLARGTIYGSGGSLNITNFPAWWVTNGSGARAENIGNFAYFEGDALYGTAQYGTFVGSAWRSNGNLDTTDNTIQVVNGELQ